MEIDFLKNSSSSPFQETEGGMMSLDEILDDPDEMEEDLQGEDGDIDDLEDDD